MGTPNVKGWTKVGESREVDVLCLILTGYILHRGRLDSTPIQAA